MLCCDTHQDANNKHSSISFNDSVIPALYISSLRPFSDAVKYKFVERQMIQNDKLGPRAAIETWGIPKTKHEWY
jgi:hypothetical protein